MTAVKHCWWCGHPAEASTELPGSGDLAKDTDTSWACADAEACARRRNEVPL